MGVSMVLAAGLAAWRTATDLSPDDKLNEMYLRYILIGGSHALHMAYKNPLTEEVPNAVSALSVCTRLEIGGTVLLYKGHAEIS
jgi:hypothetical protein